MKSQFRRYLVCFIAVLLSTTVAPFTALSQGADKNPADAKATGEPKAAEAPSANADLKKQNEEWQLQNSIADQQLRKELFKLIADKSRLELESAVAAQKLQQENAAMQAEIDKLTKQADLIAKKSALKDAERKTRMDGELAEQREKIEKVKVANELAAVELTAKLRDSAQREQELKLRVMELQAQRFDFENQVAKLNAELEQREKRDQLKNRVDREIQYTKEPFKKGILTISDRRIALNGIITMATADYIVERIDYYNNQNSENPIFIVIDTCPGGSVMAGYKILKAMDGGPAPVYVVVKSYAASMAASITTLAKKSFAYPNAIILHHQMSSVAFGNLTEQKEQIKDADEWWKRLAAPIAAKMGITSDEFIKKMYQNRTTGDWREFADGAHKLKWVDEVVDTIREESYVKNPDVVARVAQKPPTQDEVTTGSRELTDAEGHHYIALPRLDPVDCYYLYNPDNYYRLQR